MQLAERINAFSELGRFLRNFTASENDKTSGNLKDEEFQQKLNSLVSSSNHHNGWFIHENVIHALSSWGDQLTEDNLSSWISSYVFDIENHKTVAIIMAGNVPLVGFHDFLSVLMSGNKVLAKLSSNDKILIPLLAEFLINTEPQFKNFITFTEGKMTGFDAVIATGSNNTARYFDYYFGKYPNIIRKNRNSVAVLTGNETSEQMKALADDIFMYFGLGCRNVSKIFIPKGYNLDHFFNAMFSWKSIINNHKYMNNYDYNKAVYLMSDIKLLDNEFMLLKKDEGYSSPISVVFYEEYDTLETVQKHLSLNQESLQCIVGDCGIKNEIAFGVAQKPSLSDYADNVDTMKFLLKLS